MVCKAHTILLASNHFLASNYFLKNLVTIGAKTQVRVTFACTQLSLIRPTSLISHPKRFRVLSYWSFSFSFPFSFPLACVRHPICRLALLWLMRCFGLAEHLHRRPSFMFVRHFLPINHHPVTILISLNLLLFLAVLGGSVCFSPSILHSCFFFEIFSDDKWTSFLLVPYPSTWKA